MNNKFLKFIFQTIYFMPNLILSSKKFSKTISNITFIFNKFLYKEIIINNIRYPYIQQNLITFLDNSAVEKNRGNSIIIVLSYTTGYFLVVHTKRIHYSWPLNL